MNQIEQFELERIGQAIADLHSCMVTEELRPELIEYADCRFERGREPEFRPFEIDGRWGGFDCYGWFRCIFTIPSSMDGKELWVEISQDKQEWYAQNPQFLLYCNDEPVQGMDIYHQECMLRKHAAAGECLKLDFDAWSGMVTRGRSWSDKENRPGLFALRFFCVVPELRELYYDLKTPCEIVKYAGAESAAGLAIMEAISQAVNLIDFRQPHSEVFYNSVKQARAVLRQAFYDTAGDEIPVAYSIGHTHIDVAWMWQFAHTQMKTQRSFSTALKLLEEYPEYTFMSSQPQLYEYMAREQPKLFEQIREYVAQGRWEAEGGMWVEADCSLTSGESLIRQFLVGKQYIRENFGRDSRILWLPDVFGYTAALPQICKKCGIDYFMTTKISWNELDKIPYDTFLWKGIDGTEILTHFSPAKQYDQEEYNPFGFARSPHITTYNGVLEPDYIMGGWKRYSQKKLNRSFLFPYGYGDGGGGTTRPMIEKGIRMQYGIPGCPKVKFSTCGDFFRDLEHQVKGASQLPVWHGELYLEFHRGTYTSVGIVKRLNRQAENLLQRTEFLLAAAESQAPGFCWDKNEWKGMLKQFLTNQFHDILPGTALSSVYEDVKKIYRQIFQVMENNSRSALEVLRHSETDEKLLIINSLGFDRAGLVEFDYPLDNRWLLLKAEDGEILYAQQTANGRYLAYIPQAKAGGLTVYTIASGTTETAELLWKWDGTAIENDLLRTVFAEDGTLLSVFDKEAGREVLSGPGNKLETYEDRPYQYDAWELSPYYRKKEYDGGTLLSAKLVENGPVRACIRQKRAYLSSRIEQDIYFYRHSKRIDFHTRIDWREKHIVLKAAFPVDIVADKAVFEIQFGTVERPVHTNTSWDAERFETCAQRFADFAEPDYGAALLNDCKYGYDIHDHVMRLTLLRSPSFPNSLDTGFHEFTYSFLPHKGTYREAQIQKEAYDLNNPLIAVQGSAKKAGVRYLPLLVCNSPGVFLETVKPAEDGDGYIARAYEGYGCRRQALFYVREQHEISECNMLEENGCQEVLKNNRFEVTFTPFEIKTFRIKMCKNI